MTGRRPARGSGGDPWRGGRPAVPEGADRGDVELEELPVQVVARRGTSRLSASPVIAAVAIVGLLAAGFGALGGRPGASAAPVGSVGGSGGSAAPSGIAAGVSSPHPHTGPVPTPAVTPFRRCEPLTYRTPDIVLRVDGVPSDGLVQSGPSIDPAPEPHDTPVDIPADATTAIWIGGDVCARAWHIALSTNDGDRLLPLELRPNPELDAAIASQNRFDIPLAEYRFEPGELELRAAFEFPGLELVATWPIRFLSFERPQPRLLIAGEDRYFPTVEGCDVEVTFRNGFVEPLRDCEGEFGQPLPPAVKLEPGTPLRLIFDDWSVTQSSAMCGTAEPAFEPLPLASCWEGPHAGVQFPAPLAGLWTLAIAACAIDGAGLENNWICGTWYVEVDTR